MKFSFVPEKLDYQNLKHMKVNLEFDNVNGDEDVDELLEMFKSFLRVMNYTDEEIDRVQYIYLNEDDLPEEDLVQKRKDILKEYEEHMEEIEEQIEENEERRS